jgi:hypothetical protein
MSLRYCNDIYLQFSTDQEVKESLSAIRKYVNTGHSVHPFCENNCGWSSSLLFGLWQKIAQNVLKVENYSF